jgi:hypothetical protein
MAVLACGNATIGSAPVGSCQLEPPYGGGEYWWPDSQDALYCPDTTGTGDAQYPARQTVVSAFVAALQHVQPIYVIDWNPVNSSACNAALFPSGAVKYAPGFTENCARLSIAVS